MVWQPIAGSPSDDTDDDPKLLGLGGVGSLKRFDHDQHRATDFMENLEFDRNLGTDVVIKVSIVLMIEISEETVKRQIIENN